VIQRSHRIQNEILFRAPVLEAKLSGDGIQSKAGVEIEWNSLLVRRSGGHRRSQYQFSAKHLEDLGPGYSKVLWKKIFVTKLALQEASFTWRDPDADLAFVGSLWKVNGITLGDLSEAHKELDE